MNLYIIVIGIIVFLLLIIFYRYFSKEYEYFENASTLECKIQCDDSFKCFYEGNMVGSGDNWQQVYKFDIPNVRVGTKLILYCQNTGGPGWVRAQFKLGDNYYFSDLSNLKPIGKLLNDSKLDNYVGNRFIGCLKDNSNNRDLPNYEGEMSRDECLQTAIRKNMAFYGLQDGRQCYTGNSFGRWGIANNCNKDCLKDNREKCGGIGANQVYAVNQPPKAKIINVEDNSEFDRRVRALWIDSGDNSALGTWIWEFYIPDLNSLEFCPDLDYVEFNPAGCKNPLETNSCKISAFPNYSANQNRCSSLYDYENSDKFYMTLNKLFNAIVKNTEIGKMKLKENRNNEYNELDFKNNINTRIDNCNCDKNSNGIQSEFRKKYKTLIHYSNPITYGSIEYKTIAENSTNPNLASWEPYLKEFMINNLKLNRVIVIIARKMDYPIDSEQLIDENNVIPNTPMYYSLIKLAQKYSNSNQDALSQQFKKYYKKTYDIARIITGIPKFVRECSCLAFITPGTQKCIPC